MKNKKELNYEEFLHLMLECYEEFKEIMKTGTPMEKVAAQQAFHTVQQMIREQVSEFADKKGVNFKEMGQILSHSNKEFGQVCKETKERLSELRKEIEPLLEKNKEEMGKPVSKKRRKRTMEKRLRVKG